MPTLPFTTQQEADARDAEFWAAARGAGWQPGNVTTRLYGVRVRIADEPTELPDGVDVGIVVPERDAYLDRLVTGEHVTAAEAITVAPLYPAWASGTAYQVDAIVTYGNDLYVVRQAHTAQADWQPPNVLALYRVYRKDADTTLAWIASEAVKIGWHRTYGGAEYECIQAHVTQSDWTPVATLGVLWQAVVVVPPEPTWVDSGAKVTALYGAGVIGVTTTAPFSAGLAIRIKGIEASVTRIHAAGAPGILVIAPHIGVTGGEVIEVLSP